MATFLKDCVEVRYHNTLTYEDDLKDQWPFSQKFLQFLVRFSVKNFVREILRAFHKRIRSLFNLQISLPRNSSLATVSNGLIFSVENYLNWKWAEVFTVRKHITDHRVKSMWCKSAWKLTTQSLHVCKNRSIYILTTNIHRKILSEFEKKKSIILAKFR